MQIHRSEQILIIRHRRAAEWEQESSKRAIGTQIFAPRAHETCLRKGKKEIEARPTSVLNGKKKADWLSDGIMPSAHTGTRTHTDTRPHGAALLERRHACATTHTDARLLWNFLSALNRTLNAGCSTSSIAFCDWGVTLRKTVHAFA